LIAWVVTFRHAPQDAKLDLCFEAKERRWERREQSCKPSTYISI